MANTTVTLGHDGHNFATYVNELSVLFFVGLSLVYMAWAATSSGKEKTFNGPTPIPLLGNIATLWRVKVRPDEELKRINRLWGGLCALRIGSVPMMVISSPRAAKELLNDVRNGDDLSVVETTAEYSNLEGIYLFISTGARRVQKTHLSFDACRDAKT